MTQRTGGCLCGRIRFTLQGEPLAARICWCKDCQHIAGNGTVNAMFRTDAIQVTGDMAAYEKVAASGNTVTRRFCPTCGVHLMADSSGRAGISVVRVGNLDDPSGIRPTANIWSASAPAWACMDPALERVEAQPTPPPKPAA